MATLNIKGIPDVLYEKLKVLARKERRSVAQEVTQLLSEAIEEAEPLSILDLQGLGKELWQGSSASDHVDRERATHARPAGTPLRTGPR